MGASELRADLIKLVNSIDNEELLRVVYKFIQDYRGQSETFWESLSEEQKKEIHLSYEESKQDANLKKWEDIKHQY